MTKKPILPNYLPSIDNLLEHMASQATTAASPQASWRAAASSPASKLGSAKPRLGADFTHVIVAR